MHIYEGDKTEEDEDVDISKVRWPSSTLNVPFTRKLIPPTQARLRQELQTLTRLPKTGAIMFSFKTYLTPIEEVKKEGCGFILADAIEGLKTGNAPGMWVYKGASRWGKSVCEYLRS